MRRHATPRDESIALIHALAARRPSGLFSYHHVGMLAVKTQGAREKAILRDVRFPTPFAARPGMVKLERQASPWPGGRSAGRAESMTYLFSHYWGWLVVAAALGFLGAKSAHHDDGSAGRPTWIIVAAVLLAVGAAADFMHLLNGRPALWLETAGLSFVAFALGALGRIRNLWGSFIVAALVWACSNALLLGPTEGELKAQAGAAATVAGGNAYDVGMDGRDALLALGAGDAAKRAAMADRILQNNGVRMVNEVAEIPGSAEAKAAEAKAAADKAAADKAAADKAAADKVAADKSASPSLADKKAAAIAAAKTLPATGALAAADCQTALSGLAAAENLRFVTGSATISEESKGLIGRIGAVLARCPIVKIEIAGHSDSAGEEENNLTLSQRRAEAVVLLLTAGGGDAARLSAVGYGSAKPVASNDTAEGRAENRRIEFLVK
jgi:outer membrane protein OmpA-like peptidoglycan-associated protein